MSAAPALDARSHVPPAQRALDQDLDQSARWFRMRLVGGYAAIAGFVVITFAVAAATVAACALTAAGAVDDAKVVVVVLSVLGASGATLGALILAMLRADYPRVTPPRPPPARRRDTASPEGLARFESQMRGVGR